MSSPPFVRSAELLSFLGEKGKALQEFVSVTESLCRCLKDRNLEDLPRLLEWRQHLTQSIDELDEEISKGLRPNSSGGKNKLDSTQAPWNSLRRNLEDLFHQAADLDEKCLREAEFQLEETKRELLTLRQGRKAARQYLQQKDLQPRFMDVKQ